MIMFTGLNYKPGFVKDMFDKIGIEMQVIRGSNNKFKSAVEPFMYNKMSEANRLQSQQLINSVWGHVVNGIAIERDITEDLVNEAADNLSLFFADEALDKKFIDGLKYQDEINSILAAKLNSDELDEDHVVEYGDYKNVKLKATKAKDFNPQSCLTFSIVFAIW